MIDQHTTRLTISIFDKSKAVFNVLDTSIVVFIQSKDWTIVACDSDVS